MLFYQLEPFGSEAEYLGHAITASTVANVNRDPKKHETFRPEDFMPKFDEDAPKSEGKSPQELYAMFRTWALLARGNKQ
jgi:hypothetical protein